MINVSDSTEVHQGSDATVHVTPVYRVQAGDSQLYNNPTDAAIKILPVTRIGVGDSFTSNIGDSVEAWIIEQLPSGMFDGGMRIITLPTGTRRISMKWLYSRWKYWVTQDDNAKYKPAFKTVGGDPTIGGNYISTYFFLTNGWHIKPPEEDCTIQIDGILLVEGGGDPFVSTVGTYNVRINMTTPLQAESIIVETGVSGLTPDESTKLLSIPSNPVLTDDARINNLDTKVSNIPSLVELQLTDELQSILSKLTNIDGTTKLTKILVLGIS